MKRIHVLAAVIGMLVVGLAMSACTSHKMMQNDYAMKKAERTM